MRTKLTLIVSVLAAALLLSACGPATTNAAEARTLNVSGNGTVYLTPDIAYIYIGVHTENADIAQAVESNNTGAQTLVDALKNAGVDAADIQTSNYSVYSSQYYGPDGLPAGLTYMVDNSVLVTVRDLTRLGSLLTAALAFLVMNIKLIEHLTFVFPELLLIILAATLLLGRYSGYRLLDIYRFRALARE